MLIDHTSLIMKPEKAEDKQREFRTEVYEEKAKEDRRNFEEGLSKDVGPKEDSNNGPLYRNSGDGCSVQMPFSGSETAINVNDSVGGPEKKVTNHHIKSHLRRITCSKQFRDWVLYLYPALEESPEYLAFMQHLLFTGWYSETTGRILIPADTIADCMGMSDQYKQGNCRGEYSTERFLERFKRDVLSEFQWTGYHAGKGLVREVKELGIVREVLVERDRELSTPAAELEERVYFLDGVRFSAKQQTLTRKAQEREKPAFGEVEPCSVSVKLMDYMNAVPSKIFSSVVRHMPQAYRYARAIENDQARILALKELHIIEDQPKPFYKYVDNSVRIFSRTYSLTTVDGDIRTILTPDLIELDLKSSQFAIVSKTWDIPELYGFLSAGGSIWSELLEHMGLGPEWKPTIKKAGYSTVFGEERKNTLAKLIAAGVPPEAAKRFHTHRFMKEVLRIREIQLSDIRGNNGAFDCFGRWLSLNPKKKGRSVLAQLAQAVELWLLETVIDLAIEEARKAKPEFRIVLWQHDGFSIWVRQKSRRDLWIRRLQEAVRLRAMEMDIPTMLEVAD